MSTSKLRVEAAPRALSAQCDATTLTVALADGRSISIPLEWYPRLAHGSPAERRNWELVGEGHGIRWPDLDEDIGVEDLLDGFKSSETAASFKRWLATRRS